MWHLQNIIMCTLSKLFQYQLYINMKENISIIEREKKKETEPCFTV